jgi:hypothetical protein
MALNSFVSNQGSQTNLLTDNTGGTGGTLIPVMKLDISPYGTAGTVWGGSITGVGTIPGIGSVSGLSNLPGGTLNLVTTVSNLTNGSINVVAGTVNTGTINLGTVVGKDASAAARTGNPVVMAGTDGGGTVYGFLTDIKGQQYLGGGTVSMLNAGTLTTIPNIPGGTINILAGGTLGILTNGTLSSSGTTTGVGSVSSLGSLGMLNAGTISTLPNLPGGSIAITAGTIATLGTMGTLGTVAGLGTLPGVGVVSALTTGTLSPIPTIANVTFGTHGTTGVSVFGTLAGGTGSGAGTEIFITSLSLSIPSTGGSQDASIGWGSNGGTFHNGTGMLVRGNFPPGGGIQKTFYPPVNSGTQAQLMMFQAGAGTVDVSVTYFLTVSSL